MVVLLVGSAKVSVPLLYFSPLQAVCDKYLAETKSASIFQLTTEDPSIP